MVTTPPAPVVPARPRSAGLDSAGAIMVYHPAYITKPTLLLHLEVYPIRGSPVAGVPLALVLDACHIIANNAGGYLTLHEDQIAIHSDTPGDLLPPGKYYYRVPGYTDVPYPICTHFRAWKPPKVAPQNWAREHWAPPGTDSAGVDAAMSPAEWSSLSHDVKRTDGRCAVTGDFSRLNASHLVPQAEDAWFVHHRFAFDLLDGTYSLNNARNVITLRADLKSLAAFDEGHFVFFPYQGKMVTIFMTTETRDLAKDFHFSAAEIPGRIVGDFLYARFAWSIFKISARLLPIYEKDDEVAKVTVPAPLQPKPRQPPQSKKRKREEPGAPEDASDGEDSDVAEGGSGERGGDAADEDSANSASEDSFHGEQDLDVYCLTEVDLARADARDAELQRRGPYVATADDLYYPGYSKSLRIKHNYRLQHPEVSAVRTARIARVGEE